MKIKKSHFLLLTIITLIIFIIITYLNFQKKQEISYSSALEAIPLDVSIIIEINNINKLAKEIEKNSLWKDLSNKPFFKNLTNKIFFIDTMIKKYKAFRILKHKKILYAIFRQVNQYNYLICTDLTIKENEKLQKQILQLLKNPPQTKNYDQVKIFITDKFSYAYFDGIFILSDNELLIEKSIRHKHSNNYLTTNYGFKLLYNQIDKGNKIFINFENFSDYLLPTTIYKLKTKKIYSFANWLTASLIINDNLLTINGSIYSENTFKKQLSIFYNVEAEKFNAYNLLPQKTAEFIVFSFKKFSQISFNYDKYLQQKNLWQKTQQQINDFKTNYKISIPQMLIKSIDNFMLFLKVNYNTYTNKQANFIILHLKDKEYIRNALNSIITKYQKENQNTQEKFTTQIKINNINFTVYKLPFEKLLNIYLNYLHKLPSHKYYVFLNDYLIFADDFNNLKLYLKNITNKETLNYSEQFINQIEKLPTTENIIYYTNYDYNYKNFIKFFNSQYQKKLNYLIPQMRKMQYIIAKISYNEQKFDLAAIILYNKTGKNKLQTDWEIELNGKITIKPLIFLNHNTYNKEVFVQDNKNNIYLIDYKGDILWTAKLYSPIIGNIYQIDLFHNGKKQILFTLKKHLIIIDRNGNTVKPFPIELPYETNKGLFYTIYDGKKYRFFIPLKNNKIIVYDKNGKKIDGWQFKGTNSTITSPIKHFTYNNKDYIVFTDKSNLYILNRKGQTRIKIPELISSSNHTNIFFQRKTSKHNPCFILNDAYGNIKKVYLNGKIETISTIDMDINNYFVATDLNNDTLLDYIFLYNKTLYAFDNNGKNLFKYNFKNQINHKPIIFKFSKNDKKIGIVDTTEKEIYLLNSDGYLINNFPISGDTPFSISVLKRGNKYFSLIVGYKKFLYNYRLE